MKNKKKTNGVARGAPSGFLISLFIHAAAFLLAGTLVVFNVAKKEEKKFVPPQPVDRPKIKLKKPRVKVKKSAKPKLANRIVTKVTRANMSEIQLPEMSGMVDALVGGIGGFELLPDLSEVTLFGNGQSIGSDLEGVFYDFKRNRQGRPIPMDDYQFVDRLAKFTRGGWKKSKLTQYYRSPKKLYATSVMLPLVRSTVAPSAFGEADTKGYAWMVLYEGELVHYENIKFRFWGHGDDVLIVRVDGREVLNASWPDGSWSPQPTLSGWQSNSADSRKYIIGNNRAEVGDWITLEAGKPLDLEILIGEVPGGNFAAMLMVEVEGVEYERNKQGGPILPMFMTSEPSAGLIDAISEHLIPGEACVTNGPIFRDYVGGSAGSVAVESTPEPEPMETSPFRLWSFSNDKTVEAEYVSTVAGNVVLENSKGKQVKIPLQQLSADDRTYVELARPPKFDVEFVKRSESVIDRYILSPTELEWNVMPPMVNDYTFGASVRQTGASDYNHELTIEYYALGQQVLDDRKYILLDHQTDTFVPSKENNRSHRFTNGPIELMQYEMEEQRRGRRYGEHLVLLTDERGEIIQYSSSSRWLYENLEKLRKLPVGCYLDRSCTRVVPTGPKPRTY